MRTALLDLTVLPPKLPNINDQRKSSEHGKCMLPIFLAQYQPQALSRKSVVQCVYSVILVHFSCLKPCICLATAGAFHKDFNSSAVYKEPLPFVCVEFTTHPLHLLSLFVPNPPCPCYPGFQSFLIHPLNSVFSEPEFWYASLLSTWGPFLASDCLCCPSLAFQFCCILLTKGSQTCSWYSGCRLLFIAQSFSLTRASAVLPN